MQHPYSVNALHPQFHACETCGASYWAPIHRKPKEFTMPPKIVASSIHDLRVGMKVAHRGGGEHNDGEVGIITRLVPEAGDGGHVYITVDNSPEKTGIQRYFRGLSGNRKWEILPSTGGDGTTPAVGDTIRIVDVVEGEVRGFQIDSDGVMSVQLVGHTYMLYRLAAKPHLSSDGQTERSWTVTPKPKAPWQAGDIVKASSTTRVRQADGTWYNVTLSSVSNMTDAEADEETPVVRGGKRL